MAGQGFAKWWALMSPYYTKAYQEMWVGVGLLGFVYYKISFGGDHTSDSTAPTKTKHYNHHESSFHCRTVV
uniref:ATP synthase membrane subunit j n=1 Tax=Stegastes partitus TaxID=144197 RepID=A0A3B5AL21_9TELE